jgi:hypothetical protein
MNEVIYLQVTCRVVSAMDDSFFSHYFAVLQSLIALLPGAGSLFSALK